MKSLRIAFITPEFVTEEYFSGGLANYVYRVARALISLGHDVHVVTLSDTDEAEFDHDGIHVYRVTNSNLRRRLNLLTLHRLQGTVGWFDFSFCAYRKMRKLHKEHPFDIVQFPNSRACGLFTGLLLRVPYVVRISCYRPVWNELSGDQRNLDVRATEWLEQLQLRLSRNIYAPSEALKHMLAQKANIKHVRIIRSPFYLEIPEFDESIYQRDLNGKTYLLFFGRLQIHKGAHILGQALPEIFSKLPDAYAVFVGLDSLSPLGPSMRQYITQQCKGFTERLIFIDALYHEQLYPIIKGARLVVLPSLVDNLPNTMLESMGLGKVVLGTIGCSFDEIIEDGKNGFLVSPGKSDELAQKSIEIWDRNDLDKIGRNAACRIEEFAPNTVITPLIDYYQKIIDANGRK